jgi:hypothetical protein
VSSRPSLEAAGIAASMAARLPYAIVDASWHSSPAIAFIMA